MKQKFELERLLQVQRYERPVEAFWNDFDAKLQERLAIESKTVRHAWKQLWMHWMRRWTPAFATCGLVFGCMAHWAFRSTPARFVASYQPTSIQNCGYSAFEQPSQIEAMKNILQKKNVASVDIHRFTF